ncbi:hypothetical protein BZA05DRAFT_339456 [Tricharina praecox]|uniref:uncharacterized protein n=1 Tax=Tricharina praecox TaxID=43433 RepID=UPI00221EE9D9|nr:uncharacterized protein BZA05DRAFT_339456 [Tricharina praecox]KAI5849047.1 hypothetical protein BZA05DRAFT_339456 [Tricharina praecox]
MLRAIRDVAGVGQQLFHSKDGELVLKSITDESQSRPTSVIETTSNRQSMVSRRYSQVLSANVSPRVSVYGDSIPNTPLREGFDLDVPSQATSLVVVPKGGTLERLVDILVLGVEEFSRRMNRSEGGDSRPPMLRMDMDVFTITFFATYRSYCSPIVLIDYLKKRLVGSKSAASFSGNESDDVVFPDWTGVDHVKDDSVDWALVAKIHFGILDAIHIWISEFYLDFHCDQYLAESFTTFLDIAAKELAFWRSTEPEIHQLRKQADEINSLWHNIKDKFASLSFTPSTFDFPSPGNATSSLTIPQPDNISQISEFIDILDVRVAQFFASVRLVDWMFTFEQLEIQSAEPMGFFVPKIALLTHDEDGPIQDIFFLLRNLRREKTTSTLLQTLPKPLRNLCALHQDLSNWILSQVAEPKISVEVRSHRLATLLKALTICRQRMSGMDLYDSSDSGVSRHVPSFVGSAISTALVRPESRAYGFAWQLAVKNACGFVSQCETLEQVIPESVDGEIPAKPLTTSVGWMLERLLEIVCHVPNMVVENNRLINFDKRRYVYNFINNFTNHTDAQSDETHPSRHVFAPKNLEPIDMRALRDSANRENQLLKHGRIKVFWKLVHREQEKLRRDAKQRETMDRLHRNQMRAEHKRQPTAVRVETERKGGKRLGVNSIFKAVRPISIAFTSGWTPPQHTSRVVRASELPAFKVEHGRRPVATIDLKQVASITCPRKSRDKGLWKITPGSGTSYVLQATSEKDLDEWLKIVAAVRGLNVSEGAESIDLLTMASATRMPQPVFGVSLEELCRRDNVKVPIIIEGLLTEIEMRGLAEVGLYRVPGSLASINALKAALDSGEDIKMDDDRWYDINVIAGAFKSFMRELPVQALEQDILDELRDLTADIPEEEDRVPRYRETMMKLQPHNYYFLRRVYIHFARVASNAAVNKMHAVNLAIVFGMGLSPNSAHPFGVSPDLGLYQTMVKTWITYADQVFPESEDDDSRSASVIPVDSGGMPSEPNSPLSPVHDSPPGSSLAEEQWCGTEGSAGGNDGAAGVV